MKAYHEIYKQDSKGKLRVWFMEQDGGRYRTHAGLHGGNLTVSEWTVCEPTNVGRANERDVEAQATFEIEAAYKKKLTREYHETIEATSGGAHFFKPMLAAKYEAFKTGYAQPKLDGVRCIINKDGAFSREGKPLPGAAHIVEALAPVLTRDPSFVFDGELYNHELRDDFNEVIRLVKKASGDAAHVERVKQTVQYHIYDAPSAGSGKATFAVRAQTVAALVKALRNPALKAVETVEVRTAAEYDELHGRWMEEGFEGSMWRCASTPYEGKRSKSLQKRKEFQDDEFEVVRIEEGLGNWSGVAKRVVCRLPDGREFGAGIKGDKKRAAELLTETHKVVTIQYFALTPDGIPRFPVAIKFHGQKREF